MSAPVPHTTSSPIGRLPIEVLANVFAQVTPAVIPPSRNLAPSRHIPVGRQLKTFALVCRAWRSPCQRLLFQTMTLSADNFEIPLVRKGKTCAGASKMLEDNGDLGRYVQKLQVDCWPVGHYSDLMSGEEDVRGPQYSTVDLWEMISLLPAIQFLRLDVAGNPDFSSARLGMLPVLRTLAITGWQATMNVVRIYDLLSITPHITSLALQDLELDLLRSDVRLPPLNLPFLNCLSLTGFDAPLFNDIVNLFSSTTLSNIVAIDLFNDVDFDFGWLKRLSQWQNVKILRLGLFLNNHKILSILPLHLETLRLAHSEGSLLNKPVRLPDSLWKVTHLRVNSNTLNAYGMEQTVLSGKLEGKNLKEVEFIDCGRGREMMDVIGYLNKRGVRVVEQLQPKQGEYNNGWSKLDP